MLYDGGSIPPLATSVFVLRTLRTGPKPSFCRTVMPDQTDSDQSSRHRTLTGCVECGDTVLNSSKASLNCMLECKSTTTAAELNPRCKSFTRRNFDALQGSRCEFYCIKLEIRANNSVISNGLRMKSLHPLRKHSLFLFGEALMSKIGTDFVFSFWRRRVATSKPSISGRLRSRRIRSGGLRLTCVNALFPEST